MSQVVEVAGRSVMGQSFEEVRSASPSRASRRRVPERLRLATHPATPCVCR